MKVLRARRSPLLSLALPASLNLTMLILTHSLGYFRALAGAPSPAMNFTSVTVLPPAVCPQPQAYWKNNPAAWPVGTLTLGGVAYSQSELLTLLTTPTGSGKNADASLILAGQLIAAKLSIARGSDPAPVSAAIADADALLATFAGRLPYKVKPSTTPGRQMTALASGLESFNKGLLTPGCAP